eukprot:1607561-Amphidinium_carterae.1
MKGPRWTLVKVSMNAPALSLAGKRAFGDHVDGSCKSQKTASFMSEFKENWTCPVVALCHGEVVFELQGCVCELGAVMR